MEKYVITTLIVKVVHVFEFRSLKEIRTGQLKETEL